MLSASTTADERNSAEIIFGLNFILWEVLTAISTPLYKLLTKGVDWKWSSAQETAFEKSKKLLATADILTQTQSYR